MKFRNYGRNSKLISKHMIMINELIIMITIIFMMKVMIIKNKQMNNKNNNTTTLLQTYVVIKTIIKETINIFDNSDNDNNSEINN